MLFFREISWIIQAYEQLHPLAQQATLRVPFDNTFNERFVGMDNERLKTLTNFFTRSLV
jgi:hypothetical protein